MLIKEDLEQLYKELQKTFDEKMVFGDGNPNLGILFIGEAPGGDEIRQGKPFVGKAGKNLDSFMKELDVSRNVAYITNAVKFRPTKKSDAGNIINATPSTEDILRYRPFLTREINLINPTIIITLGRIPAESVFNNFNFSISKEHGQLVHVDEFNCEAFSLYHPAAVIYNSDLLSTYNKDLALLKKILKSILL